MDSCAEFGNKSLCRTRMKRITICLPVYNGEAFVNDALASIQAQTVDDYIVIGHMPVRSTRNMFGIPPLVKRKALGQHRYDRRFRYIADADLSWRVSRDAPAWHIPEVMIANRYSASNSTWFLNKTAGDEFL